MSDSLLSSYQEIQKKREKEYDHITDGIVLRSKARTGRGNLTRIFCPQKGEIKLSFLSEKYF